MSGVVHVLSASITSALAVKPSTVYVLRVENTETRKVWHMRRCFSEFCDLRERMLVLIDGQSGASGTGTSGATTTGTTGTTLTFSGSNDDSGRCPAPPAALAVTRRLLARNPSFRSGSTGSNNSSPRSTSAAGTGPVQERFPYLYSKFPRRQFFNSRTKKVIEHRTIALNQFLQEALWFMREVKMQHNIAMYFSLMTQLEVFFDCARHASPSSSSSIPTSTPSTQSDKTLLNAAPFFHHHLGTTATVAPTPQLYHRSPEVDVAAKDAADRARAIAAKGFWIASQYSHHDDEESDEEADDYEERKVLKKTISCFMDREVQERQHYQSTAGQFATMLQTRASERDAVIAREDSWVARIKIAGIPPVEALRRRNSQSQAMLLQSYTPAQAPQVTPWKMEPRGVETVLHAMKDRTDHVRPECIT